MLFSQISRNLRGSFNSCRWFLSIEDHNHRFLSLHNFHSRGGDSTQQIKISRGVVSQGNGFASKFVMADKKMDNKIPMVTKKEGFLHKNHVDDVESKRQLLKQQMLFNQQRDIQELKHTIHTTKASMQFLQMKFHEEFSNLGRHVHSLISSCNFWISQSS
ncbi:hypothetical protein AAZX31_02G200100 [Glycine max]